MNNNKKEKGGINKTIELIILITTLIIICMNIYSPHSNYKPPLHFDEWVHISNAERIKDGTHNTIIEILFDLFLVFISFFFNLIKVYQFLPMLNVLFISLLLFIYFRKYNFFAGIFSMVIFNTLPTNINFLGTKFYVPIVAVIPFIYLFLYQLDSNKKPHFWIITLLLIIISLVHQSSFLVMIQMVTIYLIIKRKSIIFKNKYLLSIMSMLIIMISTLVFLTFKDKRINLLNYFLWNDFYVHEHYSPFLMFSISLTIFAIIGLIVSYKEKKYLALRIYYLISVFWIIFFKITNYTLFSSVLRYTYHFMISSVILSSIGIIAFFNYTKKKKEKPIFQIIFIIIISISLISTYSNLKNIEDEYSLYITIYPDEIDVLSSIDIGNNNITRIITKNRIGANIKAINRYEGTHDLFVTNKRYRVDEFFNNSCKFKESAIRFGYFNHLLGISDPSLPLSHVFNNEAINCSFLELIASKNKSFLYKINLTPNKYIINLNKSFLPLGKDVDLGTFKNLNKFKIEANIVNNTHIHVFDNEIKSPIWTFKIINNLMIIHFQNKINKIISYIVYSKRNNNESINITIIHDNNLTFYVNNNKTYSIINPIATIQKPIFYISNNISEIKVLEIK